VITIDSIPLGIADFAEIRQGGFLYADKTKQLHQLIKTKKPYFLSRPRRFGKSLLVSCLKALLQGRRELFGGLWIYDKDYDWTPNPVIHLSLNSVDAKNVERVEASLLDDLKIVAKSEEIKLDSLIPANAFKSLIFDLYGRQERFSNFVSNHQTAEP
jgi:hypothetical protein